MVERRSATERHYLLADGTYRAEVHIQPIHYKAPDGSWQPIDTNLKPSGKEGYAVASETNTLRTYLPANAGGPVRVEAGTSALTFRLIGALGSASAVQGSSAQYTDSGANATTSYTVEPGQLKELITLNAPGSVTTLRYALTLEGLTASKEPNNSIGFTDSAGQTAMRSPAPWMMDADGKHGHIVASLSQTVDGMEYSLTPETHWLASARYSVTIDPTITLVWTVVNSIQSGRLNSFWIPGGYDEDWNPPPGDYLLVGAPEYSNGPYRSILDFSISGLPLDSEIQSSTLSMYADHATGDPNMQVQIYNIDKTLDPSGSSTEYPTPNNTGISKEALSVYTSVLAPLEPNFWGAYKNFDVTGLVQSWADDRSTALNLMLRDTQEDVADWWLRSSAVVYFTPNSSALTFTYTTPGWYMLQGNNRHSGNTQYPLASSLANLQNSFAQKWTTDLVTSSGELPTTYEGAQLVPSVVAVPDYPSASSGLPVLYLPVNDKRIATWDYLANNSYQGLFSGHTRIWRVEDTGSGFTRKAFDLSDPGVNTDIQATGSPIVVGTTVANNTPGHKLVVAGIRRTVDQSGAVTSSEGHVMRVDVTGQGANATMTLIWHYKFDVDDLGQGVFAAPGYWSGTTHYMNENGVPRSYTGGVILIPVHKGNSVTQSDGDYLIALALDTSNTAGQNVWGYVNDSSGDLEYHLRGEGDLASVRWGGLPPLNGPYWTEHSSPAVSLVTQRAYATAEISNGPTGGVVARELGTGEPPVEGEMFAGYAQSRAQTAGVFGDRFFAGLTGRFGGWIDVPDSTNNPHSTALINVSSLGSGSSFAAPAFFPRDHTVVAAGSWGPDDTSGVFGAATNNDLTNLISTPKWLGDSVTGLTQGAPIVTGTVGSMPFACLTSALEDGANVGDARTDIYGLTGLDQGIIKRTLSGMHGLVFSNQAAFGSASNGRSRLYIVTGGIQQLESPAFTNAAQLYCFAQ